MACPQAGPCSHQPQWPHTQEGKGQAMPGGPCSWSQGVLSADTGSHTESCAEGQCAQPKHLIPAVALSPPNPWSPLDPSLAKAPQPLLPSFSMEESQLFPLLGSCHREGLTMQKQCHPPQPILDGPSSTQRQSQLSVPQGPGWAQRATSLLVSPGRRRMHPVSPSTPIPWGCTQGITKQGLTMFGLVQCHPVTQQLRLQG